MGVVRRAIRILIRNLLRTGAIVAILAVNEGVVGLRVTSLSFPASSMFMPSIILLIHQKERGG